MFRGDCLVFSGCSRALSERILRSRRILRSGKLLKDFVHGAFRIADLNVEQLKLLDSNINAVCGGLYDPRGNGYGLGSQYMQNILSFETPYAVFLQQLSYRSVANPSGTLWCGGKLPEF